ncbi:MAG TPA: poly(R)-hydroxyalkanoic acid synthase subunit PhaE [Steroidobacteraceae bacterium]|nr:poly(R)-hydroxyalkanoic acid synthase subunit PhaE [Steroidobacteraceae bacterium]
MDVDSLFAPLQQSADRFAAAARKYVEGIQTPGPPAVEAARAFGDFLRTETMEFFRFPWNAALDSGRGTGGAPPPMQDLPAFGATREQQLRWQRCAETGWRAGDAQRRLQLLWSDALRDAAIAFAARIEPSYLRAAKATAPDMEALRALYDSWIDCAEEAYGRIAHSDSFSSALADFINASSAFRKESQAGVELWAKAFDLPTRSEVNTLMRRVNSLEERLRLKEPQDPPRTNPPRSRRPPRARRGKRP